MMSQHLPNEVVYDILTRLLVKSVLRFRCVSKSWNSILTNPIFITAHFNFNQAKSLSNNSHNGFLLYTHKISYNIKELRTVFYKVLKELQIHINAHCPLKATHKDYPWKCFFLFGIWNLWLQRNRKAFKQQEANHNLVQAVEMQVREFFYCVANQEEIKNKIVKQVRWTKPELGWIKLNTDGSFSKEGASSGCGGLLRDSNGLWIRGFAKAMMVSSSIAAEMWALREGLTLCVDLKTQAVEIELDATAAISFLSGDSNSNGDLSGLIDDCRYLLLQLPQVRILHCYREANACADTLARMGAAGDGGDCPFVSPPHTVIPFLNFDFLGKHRDRLGPSVCRTFIS